MSAIEGRPPERVGEDPLRPERLELLPDQLEGPEIEERVASPSGNGVARGPERECERQRQRSRHDEEPEPPHRARNTTNASTGHEPWRLERCRLRSPPLPRTCRLALMES